MKALLKEEIERKPLPKAVHVEHRKCAHEIEECCAYGVEKMDGNKKKKDKGCCSP